MTVLKGTQEARVKSVVDPTRFHVEAADGATYLVGLAGIRLPKKELAWDQEVLENFYVVMDVDDTEKIRYQVLMSFSSVRGRDSDIFFFIADPDLPLRQCLGSVRISIRIRIHYFSSIRIQIRVFPFQR